MSPQEYDIVIVGDLRFPGGTSTSMAQEIRTLAAASFRLALVHVPSRRFGADRKFHAQLQACVADGLCELVDAAETPLQAQLLLLHNPYVFAEIPARRPRIRAATKILVAHQPIVDTNGVPYYDAARVNAVCEELFGAGIQWAPISPTSRRNLVATGVPIDILEEDWFNLIDLDHWATDRSQPVGLLPVIGRHSRSDWQKWPASREIALQIYPDRPDVDVRLLGAGDELKTLIGDFPQNWRCFGFNEIAPAQFLRSIDFFVYYHHPDWVEGFGRNIAEALASGCVVILPPEFQATFKEAALYREPHEVVPTILEFYGDWERYLLQSQIARKFVARLCGPSSHVDRIRRLIAGTQGALEESPAPLPMPANVASAASSSVEIHETDVAIIGDMRTFRETAWRIAHETRIQAAAGYRTALLHMPGDDETVGAAIHPAIDACVRQGLATPLDPAKSLVRTRLLLIHGPEAVLSDRLRQIPHVLADEVIVVVDQSPIDYPPPYDLAQKDRLFRAHFGDNLRWAPVDEEIRRSIVEYQADVSLLDRDWTPSLAFEPWTPRKRQRRVPVIGRSSLADDTQWPADPHELAQIYPDDDEIIVRILSTDNDLSIDGAAPPESWQLFDIAEIDTGKFIDNLDFFVYFPATRPSELPTHALIEAMARGVVTILPRQLRPIFGRSAIYAKPQRVSATVHSLFARRDVYADQASCAARHIRQKFGATIHLARVRHLIGEPDPAVPSRRAKRRGDRILFVSSNGVGLGHLTRLLAVARRLPAPLEPVFATMSQAAQVIEQHGFPAEHLPFYNYAGCDVADWNQWLERQLRQIIDYYGASAVVFDGSNPYPGLLAAVGPDAGCRLAWIRRGMWRAQQVNEPLIARQQHFDLIIEPDDIAATADRGLTAHNRGLAVPVDPIRLLDHDELLDREAAAAKLGLDPTRPAMLVQLGAGSNRDIVALTDRILHAARGLSEVQIVIAEWLMAPFELDLWPRTKRLRGYPLSRYFRAFDFSIGAAGYNTYNEVISFGLPTIFIPNTAPEMDDQRARAHHAESHGAAFALTDPSQSDLLRHMQAMLNEDIRNHLVANCARVARDNGAVQTATAIADQLT